MRSRSRRTAILAAVLASAALALYLWPALAAPVVQWSDSAIDLSWARQGAGIVSPVWTLGHTAKPGYIAFLRAALAVTGGSVRGIVLVQSLLLLLSIAASALLLARRRGVGLAVAFFAIAILFLRVRDASSAVMSEALAAALFLPIAAIAIDPPAGVRSQILLGLGQAALFAVRPNLGGAAILLTLVSFALHRRSRAAAVVLAATAAVVVPLAIATSPGRTGDPTRGLTYQMFEASADDYWFPSIAPAPSQGSPRVISRALAASASKNWRRTLAVRGPDLTRQIVWRALHGLLGTDFYDARWSPLYRRATEVSRLAAPFALLAAAAFLLAAPLRGSRHDAPAKLGGLLLLAIVVVQDVVLGSNPRYALPFLPAILLLALCAAASVLRAGIRTTVGAALVFLLLVVGVAWQKSVLTWEWGVVESAGVHLEQRLPVRALPERAPATLHVRIAAPLLPADCQLEISTAGRLPLYSSRNDPARQRPQLDIALPQSLLDSNRRAPVTLVLESSGAYDSLHYLLFPVVPPPWRSSARREGSSEVSPASGVDRGALDWWAHEGMDFTASDREGSSSAGARR